MSKQIEEKILSMKFDNAQFQKNAADTSKTLDALKKGLDLSGATKGLEALKNAGKNFSLANLADGVASIASKFNGLAIIGITALSNIANKAVETGMTLIKSLTTDPLRDGLAEYELKMGSIQTILANTARHGTGLDQVTSSLDELNTYADKTIYNFGDMTKNIGLFTNAGLKVEDATSMIKGFSNEAAASGTNAQGAAGAAYQLSQALSAGTIRLMDWRSLTNVGMGNKNMQNGLIEIADAMGTLTANSTTATDVQKDFNGSLEKNWLSADVMSSYLKIMAGDMSDAEQAALGLSDAQIAAFKKQQTTAEEAATKVRTLTQLIGTMQEGVGSSWAQTFDILVGDFNEATDMWTAVSNTLGEMVSDSGEARNQLLQSWKDLGGRESVINTVANAWKAAMAILAPIKEALREIFPPTTASQLMDITKAVENFSKKLMPSEATLEKIKSTAKGFFAVLDIGRMIFMGIIGLFGRLAGKIAPASGGILDMTAGLGDWLVSVRDAVKNGTVLGKVFEAIGDFGSKTIDTLKNVGKAVGDTLQIDKWAFSWEGVGNALRSVWEFMKPFFNWVGEAFTNVKAVVTEAFEKMDFNILVGLLNVGALGTVGFVVKKAIDKLTGSVKSIAEGNLWSKIKGAFDSLTETMESMQKKLKAEALGKIAIAIGILTAAVVALSLIDTGRLFSSLGAMGVMFGLLTTSMVVIDKFIKTAGVFKMTSVAIGMTALAAAMLILAAATLIMSKMDWNELARGMSGLAVGLGVLLTSLQVLGSSGVGGKKMIAVAGSLIVLSTAIVILASALTTMGSMTWEEIARGVTTLGTSLALLVGALMVLKGASSSAAALAIISVAITVLSGALKTMANMSWEEIIRGLALLGGALIIMAGGVSLMSGSVAGAAAMLIVSAAIWVLSGSLKEFSQFSWEEIGKALVLLGGSLLILAGGMALMGIPLVMAGSVGILAASVALTMLAPALKLLGSMSWDAIGRGLTMLGASLLILAVGGLLMIPASVGFLLLGVAILAIGAGVLMAAQGLVLFAAAITALAAAAAIGSEAIKMAIMTMIELIPTAMEAFAQGLIDFAVVIAEGGVEFTNAMTTLLQSIIDAINNVAPDIIDTLWNLIMMMADKLEENIPILVEKGGNLIVGVLDGMAKNVGRVVDKATDLVVNFIDGLSRNIPRIIQSGVNFIISFVDGLADGIRNNSQRMGEAGGNLASAMIEGMWTGLKAGVGRVVEAAKNVASEAFNAAKNFLNINSPSKKFIFLGKWSSYGLADGLVSASSKVERAGTYVGQTALNAVKKSVSEIASAVATDISSQPTITPILDLSGVKSGAGLIGGLLTPPTMKVDASYAQAASIAKSQREFEESRPSNDDRPLEVKYEFNQTNNSPKALSRVDIYRESKNLFSSAKGVIDPNDPKR